MTFLQKSYGDCSKVEKPDLVTKSYEGLCDEEELELVPIINNNDNSNNYNLVNDSKSDDVVKESLFDKDFDVEVLENPKTTINAKMVQAMNNLQAAYSDDANKIVKEAAQDKNRRKI